MMNTNSDSIDAILNQITLYAQQIDEFDRFSANYVMTCVAFAGVLLGVLVAFIGLKRSGEKNKGNNRYLWRVTSFAILMIPALTTLCIYDFSLNSRRVALYRGYLRFLEERLNDFAGNKVAFFNLKIVDKYYEGSVNFMTNQWGYILVIYLVLLIFFGSIVISLYCHKKDYNESMFRRKKKDSFQKLYITVFFSFYLVCISLTVVFMVDIAKNNVVIDKIYKYCIEEYQQQP